LANLNKRDALKVVMKKRKEFKNSMKYVQDIFLPLLPKELDPYEPLLDFDYGQKAEL